MLEGEVVLADGSRPAGKKDSSEEILFRIRRLSSRRQLSLSWAVHNGAKGREDV